MPLLAFTEHSSESNNSRAYAIAAALFRWALATAYWFILTQWFFGFSIFDRVLLRTGSCSLDGDFLHHHHCKAEGGLWHGFDISGHCLLLLHASLWALEELVPFRRAFAIDWNTFHVKRRRRHQSQQRQSNWTEKAEIGLGVFLFALLALWAIMLLATSLYFHDWREKVLGTFFGTAFWAVMYGLVYRLLGIMP